MVNVRYLVIVLVVVPSGPELLRAVPDAEGELAERLPEELQLPLPADELLGAVEEPDMAAAEDVRTLDDTGVPYVSDEYARLAEALLGAKTGSVDAVKDVGEDFGAK